MGDPGLILNIRTKRDMIWSGTDAKKPNFSGPSNEEGVPSPTFTRLGMMLLKTE